MMIDPVVVIGASAAGLFAAAAAARSGREVIVLERDEAVTGADARPGVPQGLQPHVFLYRGLLATEELLPGFRQDLRTAGAVDFDTADLAWLGEQGWNTRDFESYPVFSTTRPVLEATIRNRVADLSGVEIRQGATVVGLRADGARWQVQLADGTGCSAGLVIDASGRNSRLPHWLAGHLNDAVRETVVDAKVGYATRVYRGDPAIGDIPGVVVLASPDHPAGGLALPVEGGRWLIAAVGLGEHRPPRDTAGFDDFLAGLRDPVLSELSQRLVPVGDVAVHRQTGNQRRHYEERADWPDGLLVVGDAFCSFNPIYGQGIAVAAREAVLIRDSLRRGLGPGGTRRLLRQFAKVTALPWSIATGTDLRFASCAQSPTRMGSMSNRWAAQLGKLAMHGNVTAAATLSGVYHLMLPSRQLLRPAFIWASVVGHFRGYGPTTPRPAGLPG